MRSSRRNSPRCVWNSRPGVSVIVCSRPSGRSAAPGRRRAAGLVVARRPSARARGPSAPAAPPGRPSVAGRLPRRRESARRVGGGPGSFRHGADRTLPVRRGGLHAVPGCTGSGAVDRLPEAPSPAVVPRHPWRMPSLSGGSTCRLPSGRRVRRASLLQPQGSGSAPRFRSSAALFDGDAEAVASGLARQRRGAARRRFELEDPTCLEPAERELYVETALDDGLQPSGLVDRLDVAPTGGCGSSITRPGARPRRCSRQRRCSR